METQALGAATAAKYNKYRKYKQLKLDGSEIRLLEILPAENIADGLRCRLVNVKCTDDLEFIGLSALAGDTLHMETIVLSNGLKTEVTAELGQALRHLRSVFLKPDHLTTPAWLTHLLKGVRTILPDTRHGYNQQAGKLRVWTGELCINQNDPQEQTGKQEHMRMVYQKAKMVVGWLGPRDETSDAAVEIFRMVDTAMPASYGQPEDRLSHPEHYAPQCVWLDKLKWLWDVPTGLEAKGTLIYKTVSEFLWRPYLQADWMLQEIAMATCPAFLVGDKIISWMQMLRFLRQNEDVAENGAASFPDEYRNLIRFLPLGPIFTLLKDFEMRSLGTSGSRRRMSQNINSLMLGPIANTRLIQSSTPMACAASSSK